MSAVATRRGLLGAIAVSPAALAAVPAVAAFSISIDPIWPKLVADFRTKYAAWLATVGLEEDADDAFLAARASLPPEPTKPSLSSAGDILDKTLREIRDAPDTQEHKAAWADYDRDRAAWKAQHDALREQFVGPAKAAHDRAYAIQSQALDALTTYRVTNLRDLSEKIEIIAKDYDGSDIPPEYVADILADVRNLAGVA